MMVIQDDWFHTLELDPAPPNDTLHKSHVSDFIDLYYIELYSIY